MFKRFAKISPFLLVVTALSVLVFGGIVYAATSYRVTKGGTVTVTVNEHGVCKGVKNNNASDIFIPTNTSNEWSLFRSNADNVVLSNCGPTLLRTDVYYNTGSNSTYTSTAPADTSYAVVRAWGAGGGGAFLSKYHSSCPDHGRGGYGGFVKSTISSWQSGKTLTVSPGGGGEGVGLNASGQYGAAGGGYTKVSGTFGQIIAAAGGGQGGGDNYSSAACPGTNGGDGGGLSGKNGGTAPNGDYAGGGTQTAGGKAAIGNSALKSSYRPVAGSSLQGGHAGMRWDSQIAGGFNGGGNGGFGFIDYDFYTPAGGYYGGGGGGSGYYGGGGGGTLFVGQPFTGFNPGTGGGGGSSFATASGLVTSMYSGDPEDSDPGYTEYSKGGSTLKALRVGKAGSQATNKANGGPGAVVIEYWQE